MRRRRIGGSGWAGVYGSFIGLRSPINSAGAKPKKKKAKPKPKVADVVFLGHLTFDEAHAAGLSRAKWQHECNDIVGRVEQELLHCQRQLQAIRKKLVRAERARQAAFNVGTPEVADR